MATLYKQIKDLMPSGKMEVTPEQSEALQEALFRTGKEWVWDDSRQTINSTDKPFLFWDTDCKLITTLEPHNRILFIEDENPLHHFNDYFKKE